MNKSVNKTTIAIGAVLTGYGVVRMYQYKTSQPDMTENQRTLASVSLVIGLFILGISAFNEKKPSKI